jgi:hypothetical protein
LQKVYSDEEIHLTREILDKLEGLRISSGIDQLRKLKDEILLSIPQKSRPSQGITWVLQRISNLFVDICKDGEQYRAIALSLADFLEPDDILMGMPIFMMG